MKVAIDISPLNSGHSQRGTGAYTKLLVSALEKYREDNSYYFFTRGQKVPENVDLVHYPYFDPFFLTLPLSKPKPTVVTVHDLIPIAYADHFPRGIKGELKWQIQKFSLRGAKEIITDSMASKADIVKFTGIPGNRVNTVYLCPAEIYKPVKDTRVLKSISLKYKLPKQYILYVGDVNWNKNISSLLRALVNPDRQYFLVLVGKAFLDHNLKETNELDEIIKSLNLSERIVKTGFVPEEDLPAVYSLASVYVQPSIAEGFGLPVLEAMSCGTTVVSADTSSLREIAGPAVLVDPEKPDKIAEGINSAFKIKREAWQKDSKAWLINFSPEKLVRETMEVYKKALS